MTQLTCVEICAGAGGQALGLERAGFEPEALVEIEKPCCNDSFFWPETNNQNPQTVGQLLKDLMAANGWKGVHRWVKQADDIAPTVVGGSKKHGGPDLGPTRAKKHG